METELPAQRDAESPTLATSARGSVTGTEQPTDRGQYGRRHRKKKDKSPKARKRRRKASSSAEYAACSIIADSATPAHEETQSRRPEESLSREAPAVSSSSVMPPPSTVESLSAFVTAPQSPKSPPLYPARPEAKDGYGNDAPDTPTATAAGTATPTPLVSEALTVSSVGDRSPSEQRYPSRTQKRSHSRGALSNVTFGADHSTMPSPEVAAHTVPGAAAVGSGVLASRPPHLRAASIANAHEPSTAETIIVPSALYRVGLLACALLSLAVLTFHWLAMPLLAPSLGHWCRKSEEAGNVSEAQWKSTFIPLDDNGRYSECTVYSVASALPIKGDGADPAGRSASTATAMMIPRQEVPCAVWDYDLSPGVKTLTSEWDLVCERRGLLFVAVIYNNLGGLVAMPLVGQMADRLGRWPVMVASLLLALLAAMATVFTSAFITFVVARMLVTGSLSALALVMVLAMFEGCGDRQRQRSVCGAHLVVATAALAPRLMTGLVLDRRVLCLFVLLCALALLILVLLCVDESTRWLRVVSESPGAESKPAGATAFQRFTGRLLSSMLTRKHSRTTARLRLRKQNLLGSVGLVIDPKFRTRTLVLVFTLFTLLSSLFVSADKYAVRLELLDLARLVLRVFCLVAADQLLLASTRRDALLLALPSVCLLVSVEALAAATAAESVLPLLRELLFDSILANLALVCTYSLELYPTAMRATGLGTVYFAGGVCATASPLFEMRLQRPLLELCSVLLTVTSLSLVSLLPETKDAPLADAPCELEAAAGRPSSTEVDEMFVEVDTTTDAPARGQLILSDQARTGMSIPRASTASSMQLFPE